MADVAIAPTDITRATPINVTDNDTAVSSGNTYYVDNNGKVILLTTNGAGANTLAVVTPNTVDGLAITDLSWSLTASKLYAGGPFPPQYYNDSLNRLAFTVTAAAEVMPLRVAA